MKPQVILALLILVLVFSCIIAAIEANRQTAQDCNRYIAEHKLQNYEHTYTGLTGCVLKLAENTWVPVGHLYTDAKVDSGRVVTPYGQTITQR